MYCFTSCGVTSGILPAISMRSCSVRLCSSRAFCHSWRSLYSGLPKYFSISSSPPSCVRNQSMRCARLPCTMSLFTVRESIRACIRKILASSMFSSTSQRRSWSDPAPVARICCTSASMSDRRMVSPPTTATVLSTMPLYFCALSVRHASKAAADRKICFILNRLLIFCSCGHSAARPAPAGSPAHVCGSSG